MIQDEEVAAAIHETWRALARKDGWSMQPQLDKPYDELAEADKEDNRAAARRIPAVLAVAGLGLRRLGHGDERVVTEPEWESTLDRHMEAMAAKEHNGWMAQRARTGWQYSAIRDDAQKLHPAMLLYAQLSEREKSKDRNNIRHYPDFAARANYRMVWLAPRV